MPTPKPVVAVQPLTLHRAAPRRAARGTASRNKAAGQMTWLAMPRLEETLELKPSRKHWWPHHRPWGPVTFTSGISPAPPLEAEPAEPDALVAAASPVEPEAEVRQEARPELVEAATPTEPPPDTTDAVSSAIVSETDGEAAVAPRVSRRSELASAIGGWTRAVALVVATRAWAAAAAGRAAARRGLLATAAGLAGLTHATVSTLSATWRMAKVSPSIAAQTLAIGARAGLRGVAIGAHTSVRAIRIVRSWPRALAAAIGRALVLTGSSMDRSVRVVRHDMAHGRPVGRLKVAGSSAGGLRVARPMARRGRGSARNVQAAAAVAVLPRPFPAVRPAIALPFSLPRLGVASLAVAGAGTAAMVLALPAAKLDLNGYGIVSSLPVLFYAGMAALLAGSAIALRAGSKGAWLLLGYAFAFSVIVWVAPLVLEGTPHFRTAYQNYGYVDPILNGYGLIPGLFLYHNWPVFPLLMAGVVGAGVPTLELLAWYPIFMIMAYAGLVIAFVSILGRRISGTSLVLGAAVATWSYFVFNWTEQEYFSPQAMAYLFFLVLLCLLAWTAVERDGNLSLKPTLAVLGLFTLIVATHVLTSLMCLGVLAVLVITRHIRRPTLLVTCGLIFMVWQATIAAPFFVFYGDQLTKSVLGAANFIGANVEGRVRGDAGHVFITQLRIAVSALPYALAGLAVLLFLVRTPGWLATLKSRRLPDLPRSVSFPVATILGAGIIAPVSVYGGEMVIRVLFFTLPALCALIAFGLAQRWFRLLTLAILIAMAPVHLLTQYGNEELDYVSVNELAGFDYISSVGPANVFGGVPAASTYNTVRLDARNAFLFAGDPTSLEDYADPWLHHTWIHTDWPLYVMVTRGDDAAMDLFTDRPTFMAEVRTFLDSDPDYQLVYSNPDVYVYLWKASAVTKPPASESLASGTYAEQKGAPPLLLVLASLLALGLALAVEVAASLPKREKTRLLATGRAAVASVGVSVVVVVIAGYHIAGLIGLMR